MTFNLFYFIEDEFRHGGMLLGLDHDFPQVIVYTDRGTKDTDAVDTASQDADDEGSDE